MFQRGLLHCRCEDDVAVVAFASSAAEVCIFVLSTTFFALSLCFALFGCGGCGCGVDVGGHRYLGCGCDSGSSASGLGAKTSSF